MNTNSEDGIELMRRISGSSVCINSSDIVTSKITAPWTTNVDDIVEIKNFANKDIDLRVVSGSVLELVKAMGIKVYKYYDVNFVKTSDIDNIEDKV